MPSAKNELGKLLEEVGIFVTKQKGAWDHSEWESFLVKVEKIGFNLTDETKRFVGNLLEDSKHLFQVLPEKQAKTVKATAAPKKKVAAKKA